MKQQNKLSPEQTVNLMAALMPVKGSKVNGKGNGKGKNDKVEVTKPVILALPKPNKKLKNGVFGGIAVELGRMITKPIDKPEKPTDEQRTAILLGLGVSGNAIKQVAKRCSGQTSAAIIWSFIDQYRAANNNALPSIETIDNAKLMCIKRGEFVESRVKKANIGCELWAYRCYYQLGGATRKTGQKKANA